MYNNLVTIFFIKSVINNFKAKVPKVKTNVKIYTKLNINSKLKFITHNENFLKNNKLIETVEVNLLPKYTVNIDLMLVWVIPVKITPQTQHNLVNKSITNYKYNLDINNTISFFKKQTFTNYFKIPEFKSNLYITPLVVQNKNKILIFKKNLISTFFLIGLGKSINSQYFFKLESLIFFDIFYKNHISLILKKFKKYSIFFNGINKLVEFIVVSFITLALKDLTFFSNWLKKKFENIFYRKHKKLLYLIKLFFTNYISLYLPFFKCLGFYFKIRGKIGVGGNSKKKRYLLRIGKNSLTTKQLKFNSHRGNIRTLVGILGFNLMLFYI